MGLDMYLKKRTYVGANYDHNNVKGSIYLTVGKNCKELPIQLNRVSYIEENVGYWRKANHIHAWFVENVQNGVDDCKSYHVDKSKLEELLQVCETVLKERENATELLPTQPGFFFGSTDYDEYYYNDCAKTVEIISNLLKEDNSEADFEYMASW